MNKIYVILPYDEEGPVVGYATTEEKAKQMTDKFNSTFGENAFEYDSVIADRIRIGDDTFEF